MLGRVLGALLTASAAQTPGRVQIHWEAPAGCPHSAEIEAGVHRLVGTRADVRASGDLDVEGRIRQVGDAWSMDLEIETATGTRTRELSAKTCEELAEIAIVVIAVTVDDRLALGLTDLGGESSPPSADPSPPPTLPKDPQGPPEPASEGEPREPEERPGNRRGIRDPIARVPLRETSGAITLSGAFGLGMLPGPTGGFSGAFVLLWPHARWELGATGWIPRSQGLAGTGASADIGAWHIDSRGCGVPSVRTVEFPLCVGAQAGAMSGRGHGVETPDQARLPWFAFEGSAAINARATSFLAVFVVARLTIPVTRPGFQIDDTVVHRAGSASFSAVAGLEARWKWPRARRSAR